MTSRATVLGRPFDQMLVLIPVHPSGGDLRGMNRDGEHKPSGRRSVMQPLGGRTGYIVCAVRQQQCSPVREEPLGGRTGYIVCAFADEATRERAYRSLQAAEFDAVDLTRLDTRQMGERLAREATHDGGSSNESGERLDLTRHWLDSAANEQAWLLVRTSSDRQLLVAQLLLRTEQTGRAVHFGPMWIENPAIDP